jgi:hypothetical protein
MNDFYRTILFSIILVVSFSFSVEAQKSDVPIDAPVVFGKIDDKFPDKMKISGTITDLTFSSGCGVLATAGTLKIRLDKKVENYSFDNVYVVKPCFGEFEKFGYKRKSYIGKKIELEVSKLLEVYYYDQIKDINKVPCAFDLIHNEFDSSGTAFYCTNFNITIALKK